MPVSLSLTAHLSFARPTALLPVFAGDLTDSLDTKTLKTRPITQLAE
jgi:hypothetical protein